jgi:hypothetical protein
MDQDLHVEVTPEEVAPVFPSYHPRREVTARNQRMDLAYVP